jgi:5-methylthioribose kinase
VDVQLLSQFTGIEILRRLIGLAQLPLERSLEEKERLLELGYELVVN